MLTPANANRPVIGWQAPILISSSAANAAAATNSAHAITTPVKILSPLLFPIVALLRLDRLVFKRPQREIPLRPVPHFGQAVRLENEESHDHRPEQDVPHREEV